MRPMSRCFFLSDSRPRIPVAVVSCVLVQEASRAQGDGSSLPMPVVNVNGQDVTVPSAIIIGAQVNM